MLTIIRLFIVYKTLTVGIMKSRQVAGENIRRLRVRLGLSQEQLAFEAELDRTYVSGLERGDRNPSLDVLDRISQALGVNTHELLVQTGQGKVQGLKPGRKPIIT
jgi:transcriptional regulator with XRE-family HTH domain